MAKLGAPVPESLSLLHFKRTGEKVDRLAFHPVLPWIAYTRRDNVVGIWDYQADHDVYTAVFGSAGAVGLDSALQEDGAAKLQPEQSSPSVLAAFRSSTSGSVRGVAFLDSDVCFWQLGKEHLHKASSLDSAFLPTISASKHKILAVRWLAVVCEAKVVLHSIMGPEVKEIPRSLLDGKSATCIALLLMHYPGLAGGEAPAGRGATPQFTPLLAVATSGGSIFVIDPQTATLRVAMVGAHKGAVAALQVLGSETANGADRLISAGVDGTIAVWEPSAAYGPGARREISPRHSFKAHDAAITGLALLDLFQGEGTASAQYLATTGEDRKVALWHTSTWALKKSAQPLPKASFHSVVYTPWGDSTLLMGLHPESAAAGPCLDLGLWLDPGPKKAVKAYHAAGHPLKPSLAAVATNTGVALVGFASAAAPPVAALPHQVLSLENLAAAAAAPSEAPAASAPSAIRAAQGFTCLAAAGQALWTSSLRLESAAGGAPGAPAAVRLDAGEREAVAQLEHPGPVVIACSASGRSVSVVWPEKGVYCVYSLAPSGAWEAIDRGSAISLVWNSLQPQYALLCSPPVVVEAPRAKKGMFAAFGRRKAEKAAVEQGAESVTAGSGAARPGSYVQVHAVDEGRAAQWVVNQGLALDGLPSALHGGAMLGVVLEAGLEAGRRSALQLFSWTSFAAAGPLLQEPRWISWEPECTALALAYDESVELVRTTPRFEVYASLPVAEATGGLWQTRQLFLATPTSVLAVFTDPAQEFVQTVVLAGCEGMPSAQTSPNAESSPLPHAAPRPPGPLVLLGVRHSYLWLADGLGRPYLLSLRHAGVRLRCLAARAELSTARTIAERGLGAVFHDDIARYLVAMGGQEGVAEALRLTGLSPSMETVLAVRAEDWDRAAAAFQTLALGIKDRTLLQVVQDSGGSLLEAPASMHLSAAHENAGLDAVARILEEDESGRVAAAGSAAFEAGEEGSEAGEGEGAEEEAPPQPSVIDWDAALVPDGADDPFGEAGAAPTAAPGAYTCSAALQPVLAQGLDLADAAIAAGRWDAARMVLGVFVRMAGALPRAFLGDLVLRLALVGGRNTSAIGATLAAAELHPLAAVFADVWGVGGGKGMRPTPEQAWAASLDADDPHRAARFVVSAPLA